MKNTSLQYQIPQASWKLEICSPVIDILSKHVQHSRLAKESVGQLYAKELTTDIIRIEAATLLKPISARRTKVQFSPAQAMAERKNMHKQGFHCLGLWHSHPEPDPTPSYEDIQLAADYALAAKAQLNGIVFAILGTSPFPSGLTIWVHDGKMLTQAVPFSAATRKFDK
ncbi:MAG: hypothetical protein EPN76_09510 [Burkholderiaceae bacterium]|nr:MAG: hypothetical protein EPN76_09510 [Burkholderiaceae bacterium]TAM04865.1 MAG: hypothetical protein EPN67_07450 [Pusillimonas sp.]